MSAYPKSRLLGAVTGVALLGLTVTSACGGDGTSAAESHAGGSAGTANEAGAASKGDAGSGQAGTSSSGGSSQAEAGRAGASGAGTSSVGGTGGAGSLGAPCRADGECSGGLPGEIYCSSPGAATGCGACPMPIPPATGCSTDADCRSDGGSKVCEHFCGGVCPMGSCVAGCTAETVCPTGMACGASGRCQASACTVRADCPPDFDCLNSVCARVTCTSDADCDDYCVDRACYPVLGVCTRRVG